MNLSPSETHGRLSSNVTPALQYDGGDVKAWQQMDEAMAQVLSPQGMMPCLFRTRLWMRQGPAGPESYPLLLQVITILMNVDTDLSR